MFIKCLRPLAAALFLFATCGVAPAGGLAPLANALDNLSDIARSADRANEAMRDAMRGSRPYSYDRDYDNEWARRDTQRERQREYDMARACGVSRAKIHRLRRSGMSWGDIADRYDLDNDRRAHKKWKAHRKRHHHDDDDDDD